MSIDVQPHAEYDVEVAVDKLRGWRAGAAERFVDQFDDALAKLERLPHFAPRYEPPSPTFPELRVYPIPKDYGHLVFYQPIEGGIRVLRVLHGSRNIAAIFGADPT